MQKPGLAALSAAIFLTFTSLLPFVSGAQRGTPAPRGAAGPPQPQSQPQQPPGTATLSGTVVAMGSNQPIPGASVEIRRTDCGNFSNPPDVLTTTTDRDGRFTFKNMRAGGWCAVATVAGGAYTPAEYMQRSFNGRGATIPVVDGQHVENIDLALAPTGGVSGRVLDGDGEPLAHARVQVLEPFYEGGRRKLYILQSIQANDLGAYRFFWLPPGRYYVAVTPEDSRGREATAVVPQPGTGGRREETLAPVVTRRIESNGAVLEETGVTVYYPGDTDPDRAAPVDVGAGVNVAGIDFLLTRGRAQSFHVRGNLVNGVTGDPAVNVQVRIVPREWSATVVMPRASTDAKGDFDIAGVIPGFYVLYASATYRPPDEAGRGGEGRGASPAGPGARGPAGAQPNRGAAPGTGGQPNRGAAAAAIQLGARAPLNIGFADTDNLRLALTPGADLAGRVQIEPSGGEIPRGLTISLARDPDIVGAPVPQGRGGAVQTDGSFMLNGVGPGDYRVLVAPFITPFQWSPGAPPRGLENTYVKSARFEGIDTLGDGFHLTSAAVSSPIEITLATGGRVTGAVYNDRRETLANVTVALVPDLAYRKRADLFRTAGTDHFGRFQIQGVPPGSYKAFAWQNIERDIWQVPEYLQTIENRGVPVDVREGGEAMVDIEAISAAGR
ncbi:MAG TPA: carboxypeptidase-like regulatory domain-containing protein [Terriglobia bacterium]|nr:carboxypeptidase-like regulatory domain-containing protein [Terriglobia bacterium]